MKTISHHPFEPFVPDAARVLVIGTIPPPRFCKKHLELYSDDVQFYYGSKDNHFWKIIENIFQERFDYSDTEEAVNQRKHFLKKSGIGITDVIKSCYHNNDSASDSEIKDIVCNDLKPLLKQHPSIVTLIYTSEYVKKLLKIRHRIDKKDKKIQCVKINDKVYNVVILYSPSPSALRNMGVDGQKRRLGQYSFALKPEKHH